MSFNAIILWYVFFFANNLAKQNHVVHGNRCIFCNTLWCAITKYFVSYQRKK